MSIRNISDRTEDLVNIVLSDRKCNQKDSVSLEYLIDAFICLYYECCLPQHRQERNCAKFSENGLLIWF